MKNEKNILIVEDEKRMAATIKIILQKKGYKAFVVNDGWDAVNWISSNSQKINISLILCDIELPFLNGIELEKELIKRSYDLNILFMTGYNDSELEARKEDLKGLKIIYKPFFPHEILSQVKKIIG